MSGKTCDFCGVDLMGDKDNKRADTCSNCETKLEQIDLDVSQYCISLQKVDDKVRVVVGDEWNEGSVVMKKVEFLDRIKGI